MWTSNLIVVLGSIFGGLWAVAIVYSLYLDIKARDKRFKREAELWKKKNLGIVEKLKELLDEK